MAKSSKKQQKRLQKKKKSRDDKRRQLRHTGRSARFEPIAIPKHGLVDDSDSDERILRSQIQEYAYTRRFEDEFSEACALYFGRKK